MRPIDKKAVAAFFDRLAPGWDGYSKHDGAVINRILDNALMPSGADVLDVACGTGVMIPYYLTRGAKSVTAADVSGEMIKAARKKDHGGNVDFVCADAETYDFGKKFGFIAVYNALPHFASPRSLVASLASLLDEGGILTVAHGAGREEINACHSGVPQGVSNELIPARELAELFQLAGLEVFFTVSDEANYQVAGRKNPEK